MSCPAICFGFKSRQLLRVLKQMCKMFQATFSSFILNQNKKGYMKSFPWYILYKEYISVSLERAG
jgi:hypothetical protein